MTNVEGDIPNRGGTSRFAHLPVGGWSEPGFGSLVDRFADTLVDARTGAALSVWVKGQPVVEVFGGLADDRTGRVWTEDTISVIFSSTKGLAAIAVAMLVERGLLASFEIPLAQIWPEFGASGKETVSLGDALAHRAGVSAPRRDMTFDEIVDGTTLAAALAAQEPLWEPGTNHHYHGLTIGTIFEEVVARASGRPLSRYLAEEVAGPLRADVWLPLPASEVPRLAQQIDSTDPAMFATEAPTADPEAVYWNDRAMTIGGGFDPWQLTNPTILRHVFAGGGAAASASGLARIWSATVTETLGRRLIGDQTVEALRARRSEGEGRFPVGPPPYQSWGAGVMVPSDWEPYLTPESFGHDGAGGQVAFADPSTGVGFAYLTNWFGDFERGQGIVRELGRVLGV
jgi:CubicO group peptidase (beta-lactamase class C family)